MTGSEPTKILLIEDNPGDVRLIQEMLSEVSGFSFHMECVDCLSTGLERLAKRGIDLVLLDLSLPDSQIPDTFAKVKAQTQEIPIVVLSGHADEEWAVMSIKDGAQDYLVKGQVDSKPLVRSIRYAIERHNLQARLDYVARYDAITGLPNRILFLDRLSQAIAHAQREKRQVAVLLIHPGRLKSICEQLGHMMCDSLFKTVANRLTDSLRTSDVITRLGREEDASTASRVGEYEFAVLLPEISGAHDAARVAQRILDAFSENITADDRKFVLNCSIGITIYPSCGDSGETLLKNANIAMSHIKKGGKGDYQFYSPEVGAGVSERIALEDDLRKALERKELLVYYQPAVDLATGQITGMEALVRWRHPERGLVSPGKFIPLVEEMGLIIAIGEWVLRTACIQNRAWYDAGLPPIRISVNFSTYQFRQQNVIELITRAVKETGLDPHYLELEITESALMEARGVIVATLLALKEMGMGISIDDFGTGYSSLSKLKHLPIDKLKVDQSFVRDVTIHPADDAIVSATIAMAHSLRLKVVAEGVETPQQLEFLRSLKCDEMQGYLFSPPLPAEEATKLLAEGKRLEL
ncbi:MAG TPA: EAL domain-containing response regulator [Candidatus Avalokitesvara rifleensis]|uniref:EAL domain-containing response regulator n=1 Tax=Candidatus Avalokitesvara rifleensis TaxID=3367620 RepID=UPI00402625F4